MATRHRSPSPKLTSSRPRPTSTGWPRWRIDYDDVVKVLEVEGVDKFTKSWLELLEDIEKA